MIAKVKTITLPIKIRDARWDKVKRLVFDLEWGTMMTDREPFDLDIGFIIQYHKPLSPVKNFLWSFKGASPHRHHPPQRTDPPLTLRISPVMCRAKSEARKTIGPAMSSGGGTRLRGIVSSTFLR